MMAALKGYPVHRRRVLALGGGAAAAVITSSIPARASRYESVGVIFVGASWCPYCKQAAPVLAALLEPAGIPVLVASHDARPILPFERAEDARTHPVASRIDRLPTTLIYSRVADDVIAQIEGYRGARLYAARVASAIDQAAQLSLSDFEEARS